jgi:cytoskeletal protein CcmA (bactofilin family)
MLEALRSHRALWLLPLLVLAVLLAAASLFAQGGGTASQTVTVAAGEVVPDDLYAAGETVRILGTVQGDLVAAGREVIVEGTVEGDLLAAAQLVSVTGSVGDDARIAGQVLHLGPNASIGDDLRAAGYSLEAEPGSFVGGTATVFAYQALFAGGVEEEVRGELAALEIEGSVGGNVNVEVGSAEESAPPVFWPTPIPIPSVRPGLTVADGARLNGDLDYESPDPARVAPGAVVAGELVHRQVAAEGAEKATLAQRSLDALRRFVALLLVGGLLLVLAPGWTAGLAERAREKPIAALGWGLVFLAGSLAGVIVVALGTGLVATVLGLATLKGLVASVIGAGLLTEATLVVGVLVVCVYLPPVVVGLAGGRLALAPGKEAPARGRSLAALALGVFVLVLLGLVPVLGTVVRILVLLLGLGALWLWSLARLRG